LKIKGEIRISRAVQKCSDARRSVTPAFAGVNSADERFVKPSAFSGKEGVHL
jgi:hypothetical protein